MTVTNDPRASGRLKFLLIVAIAVVPIMLAYGLYFYFRELAPAETTNEGHLVQPPRQIEQLVAATENKVPLGKWAMLIPSKISCDDNCEQLLYLSRQVHTALGKESDRVRRFLMVGGTQVDPAFGDLMRTEHPEMQILYYPTEDLRSLFDAIVERPLDGNYLFLMDPNGNVMMYYTLEQAGEPMLKDLKHLLRVSKIG